MKLLVVDDDADIRELLGLAIETKMNLPIVRAASGNEAIALLKSDPEISGVICDYNMPKGNGGDVFKFLLAEKKSIPFALCSSEEPEKHAEFVGHTIAGFLEKPFTWDQLAAIVQKIIQLSASNHQEEKKSIYCPIRLNTLIKANVLDCDLYIKLSEEKYIKLMKKGETFGEDDYERYFSKKLEFLYLKKDECDAFLTRFANDINSITQAKALPWDSSYEVLEAVTHSLYSVIQTFGFTEQAQNLAKSSTRLAIKSIMNNIKISELIKANLKDPKNFLHSHTTLLSLLICLLASQMGWTSETTQYKLALAALLHDITLSDSSMATIELHLDTANALNSFDRKGLLSFMSHPQEGVNALKSMKELPPDVDDMILHHHEQPNGSGFSNGLTSAELSPLASLFIVAHDLVGFIWKNESNIKMADFVSTHEQIYIADHFKKILSSLQAMSEK